MPLEVHSILGVLAADRWMNCTLSVQLTTGMEDEITTFAAEGTAAHALCEWKVRKCRSCDSFYRIHPLKSMLLCRLAVVAMEGHMDYCNFMV